MTGTYFPCQSEIRWRLDPSLDPLRFGSYLPLEEWVQSGQARFVKLAPHRKVLRVRADGEDLHIKQYKVHGLRGWLRECLRPIKARREHDVAMELQRRGIPTHEPLGWGLAGSTWWPNESYLITRTLDDATSVTDYIDGVLHHLPTCELVRERQRLARALGEFLARMHDAGVVHHDLHPGNLLLRREGNALQLYLIDLHMVEFSSRLPWSRAFDNLVVFNRYFMLRAEQTDRRRFWEAYVQARQGETHLGARAMPLLLERASQRSNRTHWSRREARCLSNNRVYRKLRFGPLRGHILREFEPPWLLTLLRDPDAWMQLPDAELLKESPRSTVVAFRAPVGGTVRSFIFKRFQLKAKQEPWLSLLRRSAALRSWQFGHGLRERFLPTARPWLVVHRYRNGLAHEGYLLTDRIDGASELHTWANRLPVPSAGQPERVLWERIESLGRLLRQFHGRGLAHRDLKAANVLTADAADDHRFWFIDLVGVSSPLRASTCRRVRDLARLHVSFIGNARVSRTCKLRFLRTYLNGRLHGWVGWKRWWRAIDARSLRKLMSNIKRGRPVG